MPTERFMRLAEAKKQTIREAAVREFARVPFEKASINQIIQNAGISRGSFYTYFEDKRDLLEFVFADGHRQMKEYCEEELKRLDGDFFAILERLFEYMISKLQEGTEMLKVTRNVFYYKENSGFFCKPLWEDEIKEEDEDMPYRWLWERIDCSRLKCSNAEEFIPVLSLGLTAMLISVKQYYEQPEELERIRHQLHAMLEVLQTGVLKEA